MNASLILKVCFLLLTGVAINHNLPVDLYADSEPAAAQVQPAVGTDPLLGEITMFAGNFAPRNWAFCNGQLLSIAENSALFSILGTTYGGDGRTTFGLPDLRGRVPVHSGNSQGPGLSDNYRLGQKGGVETVTLTGGQMPAHSHPTTATLNAGSSNGLTTDASNNVLADQTRGGQMPPIYTNSANTDTFRPDAIKVTVGNTGSGQAHENRMPYQAINFIIAIQGVYPSRQ